MTERTSPRTPPLAWIALVFAALALLGLYGLGTTAFAVFAVGFAHLSAPRPAKDNLRPHAVSYTAMAIGYVVGVLGMLAALSAALFFATR